MKIEAHMNLARMEISSADPAFLLTKIAQLNVTLFAVKQIDELTFEIQAKEKNLGAIHECVIQHGGTSRILQTSIVYEWSLQLPKRMIILMGIVALTLLTLWIPRRIWFIRVSGNTSIPTKLILSKAEDCGIGFGTVREHIRSEEIKNNLISSIPKLQWVGVNTEGCVAEISVSEKDEITTKDQLVTGVSNIVAGRDGVIISKTILQGTDICRVGEAVTTGQLLVSGYSDCGMLIRATNAQAEILAKTKRQIDTVTPINYQGRKTLLDKKTQFSIMCGKKLIKLYKGSGISGGSCVKIYKRDYMQLPGGYYLPICFITEHIYVYQTKEKQRRDVDWLYEFADTYLVSQMVAGQIIDSSKKLSVNVGSVRLTSQYDCTEMIGQRMLEENIDTYGVCN